MITPRRTRVLRVPDLRTFQRAIVESSCRDLADPTGRAVIVPTRAAADQLRRTIEHHTLGAAEIAATWIPDILTRREWYSQMHGRLRDATPVATEFEREVIVAAAARAAIAAGTVPPFALRPRLVAELLDFYDELRRLENSLHDFERRVLGELRTSIDTDRGAERLADQTSFLAETFRRYELRLREAGLVDEHGLRERLLSSDLDPRYAHVVVTVADHVVDEAGLWPADFDLLARLSGVEEITIIATERMLAAGLQERLARLLPEAEEQRIPVQGSNAPTVVAPAGREERFYTFRDREEELVGVARALKARLHAPSVPRDPSSNPQALERTAVVFARPLPYVYLARRGFDSCGVPCQTFDTLPLAAEPWATVVDLVCTFVLSDYTRTSAVELLRSPHLALAGPGGPVTPAGVAALDRRLLEERYLGGRGRLVELARQWAVSATSAGAAAASAAALTAALAEELAPLEQVAAPSSFVTTLLTFLQRHSAIPQEPEAARNLRARAAILGALENLKQAHLRHDDEVCTFGDLAARVKRWIEGQTFAPRVGEAGIQLVDASSGLYGTFDAVHIAGLIETDWPDRSARSIFYPRSVLIELGWAPEADRLRAARARFLDLLRLPATRVSLSTFLLEDDAIVSPSILLEELPDCGLPVEGWSAPSRLRVSVEDALSSDPVVSSAARGEAAEWLALRRARRPAEEAAFHGSIGQRAPAVYAVQGVERYLNCPFQYFASRLLGLEEERQDETTLSPRTRGQLVHAVLAEFFTAWHRSGRSAIAPDDLEDARALLQRVAERFLADLPAAEREVERTALFGSAAMSGIADRLLYLEAEVAEQVRERLVEYPLEGDFTLDGPDGPRRIALRGRADRIDLLGDGTFRLIDYKLTKSPRPALAVQLPVYAVCAEQQLVRERGGAWTVAEAAYYAFGDPRGSVPLGGRDGLDKALARGQERFVLAIEAIECGDFPPRPAEPRLCGSCAYPTVCRRDYVDAD